METCKICNQPILSYNGRGDAPFVGLIEPSSQDFEKHVVMSDVRLISLVSTFFYKNNLNLQDWIVFFPARDHKKAEPSHWLMRFLEFYHAHPRRGIVLWGSLKHSLGLSYPCALTLNKLVVYSTEIMADVVVFPNPEVVFSTQGDLELSVSRFVEVIRGER